nr:hypothetical protein [Tanacetum cinerariifolium]
MIAAQVGDLTSHTTKYTSPTLTQKQPADDVDDVVANDVIADVVTDVVAHAATEPTPPSSTPTTTPPPLQELPSTSQVASTPPPSPIAQPSSPPQQQHPSQPTTIFMDHLHTLLETCTTLTRRVDNLEQDKIAQDLEITKRMHPNRGIIALIDADKDVILEEVDAKKEAEVADKDAEDDEPEPAKLQEVIEMVTTAKLMIEVVTVATTTIIAAPSATRRRKGVVIRDPRETSTPSTIVHSELKSKDKGKIFMVQEPKALKNSEEKAAKKQKLDEEVEELKKHLQIILNDEDDVYTEATPLALNVPVVDYEIYTENNKPYYKIIRAYGTHQLFLSFLSLLRNFDREYLEMLWQIVQEIFASLKPNNFLDDFLLAILKAMFEKPDICASVCGSCKASGEFHSPILLCFSWDGNDAKYVLIDVIQVTHGLISVKGINCVSPIKLKGTGNSDSLRRRITMSKRDMLVSSNPQSVSQFNPITGDLIVSSANVNLSGIAPVVLDKLTDLEKDKATKHKLTDLEKDKARKHTTLVKKPTAVVEKPDAVMDKAPKHKAPTKKPASVMVQDKDNVPVVTKSDKATEPVVVADVKVPVVAVDKASDALKNKPAGKGKKPVVGKDKDKPKNIALDVVKEKFKPNPKQKEDDRKKIFKGKSKKDVSDFELETDVVDYSSNEADQKRKKLKIKAESDEQSVPKKDKKKLTKKVKKEESDEESVPKKGKKKLTKKVKKEESGEESVPKKGKKKEKQLMPEEAAQEEYLLSFPSFYARTTPSSLFLPSKTKSDKIEVTPSKIHDMLGVPFEGYSLFDLDEREADHEFLLYLDFTKFNKFPIVRTRSDIRNWSSYLKQRQELELKDHMVGLLNLYDEWNEAEVQESEGFIGFSKTSEKENGDDNDANDSDKNMDEEDVNKGDKDLNGSNPSFGFSKISLEDFGNDKGVAKKDKVVEGNPTEQGTVVEGNQADEFEIMSTLENFTQWLDRNVDLVGEGDLFGDNSVTLEAMNQEIIPEKLPTQKASPRPKKRVVKPSSYLLSPYINKKTNVVPKITRLEFIRRNSLFAMQGDKMVIQSKSHEIHSESHAIYFESHVIHSESYVIHFESHKKLFARHMKQYGHIRHAQVAKVKHTIPKLEWKTKENFYDCGIFTMLHMETFNGGPASNLDYGLPVES